MQTWYLISKKDADLVEAGLKQIQDSPAPALEREVARATIHTLVTSLHTTEAIPEDFRNE
ncbi:hypothetical protein LCGC14_2445830 [marine sediment metagenome]|uniref:Uncharacterized protein n=1 Tax=marine sediment metagenome TaxID=412755 RepID=A0A0F9C532_9ZZZZ